MYGSRKFHKDKKLDLMLMEDSDPEDSEPEDVKAIKGEGEFRKVKRMPGMYYKVIISCFTKIVSKCLVTRADTACDFKPITAHTPKPILALRCTHIGPHVQPYPPSRAPAAS